MTEWYKAFGSYAQSISTKGSTGPNFPPAEVEAARVRALKRRIRRRVAAMIARRNPSMALLFSEGGFL